MRQFPSTRLRRNRRSDFSRRLVSEHRLSAQDLIYPVFVTDESASAKHAIASMPGQYRYGIDSLMRVADDALQQQIPALALFPKVDSKYKDAKGSYAYSEDGLIPQAVQALKERFPELGIICDGALDPYTSHGQDGLVNNEGYVLNDETIEALCRQAVVCAQAGADIIAPSDMMDGRIGAIRSALDNKQFELTQILAYSAKYASTFYGPFRDAVGSSGNLGKADKRQYQMDPANAEEALHEVEMDIAEGADMVMVKPGMPYLDIVKAVKERFGLPTLAYQVSGEYSMLRMAVDQGILDATAIGESLLCFKRAGADAILSYFALDIAKTLPKHP